MNTEAITRHAMVNGVGGGREVEKTGRHESILFRGAASMRRTPASHRSGVM